LVEAFQGCKTEKSQYEREVRAKKDTDMYPVILPSLADIDPLLAPRCPPFPPPLVTNEAMDDAFDPDLGFPGVVLTASLAPPAC